MSIPAIDPDTFSRLLHESGDEGDEGLDQLLPHVYGELRRLARHYMRRERPGHTLQTTALVHEAYARLVGTDVPSHDRARFFRVAGRAMRQVLVDHARARASAKRGGDRVRVTFEEARLGAQDPLPEIVELDDALKDLAIGHARQAQVVELHFFVGLSYEEVALVLGLSPATVDRDMRFSRAWLRSALVRSDHQ